MFLRSIQGNVVFMGGVDAGCFKEYTGKCSVYEGLFLRSIQGNDEFLRGVLFFSWVFEVIRREKGQIRLLFPNERGSSVNALHSI